MKKISHLLNSLPKRVAAGALIALSVLLPVANSAADAVLLSGSMGVANVTAGSTAFEASTTASENQEVKLSIGYKNQEAVETGKIANNVRVQVSIPGTKGATQTQTATVAGENTNTVSASTSVALSNPEAYLQYVPGSAVLRYTDNGVVKDTALPDSVVGAGAVVSTQTPAGSEGTVTVRARVVVDAPVVAPVAPTIPGPVQTTTPKTEPEATAVAPAPVAIEAEAAPATEEAVANSQAAATDAPAVALAPADTQVLARAAAAGCDKVNVIYCGLSGSGVAGYIASAKEHYRTGRDSYGHTDIRQVMNWGGYGNVIGSMTAGNTKLGTMYRDGRVVVDGKVVATDSWITARFGSGRPGFVQVTNQVWARKTTTDTARSSYPVMITFNAAGKAVAGIVTDCGNVLRFAPTEPPKPVLVCKNLRREIVTDTRRVKFTAIANAQNTKIQNYKFVFGDGTHEFVKTGQETATTTHAYPDWNKEYTARVYVNSDDIKDRTSPDCVVTFKTPRKPNPSVDIEKKVSKSVVKVGEEFVYTLKVTNDGNRPLTNVKVTDPAPEGVKFLSADKGEIKDSGKRWIHTINNLEVDGTRTFKITAKATKYMAGQIVNTACVDAPEVPGNPDDCDKVPITIPNDKPSVMIEKTVNKSQLKVGEEFAYTVKVTNNGNVNLTNAVVTDPAPEGIAFLSASEGTVNAEGTAWSTTIPALAVGASKEFTLNAKVTKYMPNQIVNTACVDAPEVPGNPDDCDDVPVIITEEKPSVLVEKVVSKDQLKVGEKFTYTVKVTNNGNKDLTNVAVKDPAPEGVKFLSASEGTVSTGGTAWSATIEKLAIGQSMEFTLEAEVVKYMPSQIVNTVCVDAPEVPGNPDDCDDVPVVVTQEKPSVIIAKTTNKSQLKVGEEFAYTVKVTNNGNVNLTNAVVTDPAPEGIAFLSASEGTVNAEGTAWSTTIPALAVGASKEFTLNAKVTKYMPNQIVNTACVDAPEVPGNPDDCDDVPVTVVKITKPVYSCDMLTLTPGANRTVTASVRYIAAGGPKFKSVTFDFGDGNKVTTDKTTREHQYAQDGTYTVTARVLFSVNGTDTYAPESENCKAEVKFTSPEQPGVVLSSTTPTKTTLPDTGPAGIALIASAVAVVAAVGHQLVVGRHRAF